MSAFLLLKGLEDREFLRNMLYVVALGSSGNGKEIQRQLDKWERET